MASGKTVETDLTKGILNNTDWTRRWIEKDIPFHQGRPEPFLLESEETIFEGKKKSVFVPLCGKAEDLYWLYERGHTVCGVEFAEQPIREFLDGHNMEFDVRDVENVGKLLQTKDGRLKIYRADLFDITVKIVGQFDIFDCRSMIAINLADHQLYKELQLSLMKPTSKWYMYTLDFDTAFWPGPPHATSEKSIRSLLGDRCEVELLRKELDPTVKGTSTEPPKKMPANYVEAINIMPYLICIWSKIQLRA